MPRGYRCIVIAIVGWLSLTAQTPNARTGPEQNQAANAVAETAKNIAPTKDELAEWAHRAKYEAECDPAKEQRDSDLCAQWKAADAAAQAAKWTKWGTWVSAISGLLVLFALYLAFRSNWIARDTAKRQLRAYLALDGATPRPKLEVGKLFGAKIELMNAGQTPAKSIVWVSNIRFAMAGTSPDFSNLSLDEEPSVSVVGGGLKTFHNVETAKELSQDVFDKITSGAVIAYIYGTVDYEDVFKAAHKLTFRLAYDARMDSFYSCSEGNYDT